MEYKFSILGNGWTKPTVTDEISLRSLIGLIKFNPEQEKIKELQTLVRGSEEYNEIKASLPCVKPHGTFKKYAITENFVRFSGFLYFDIDSCDVVKVKSQLIDKHSDKIFMLGKSVGGRGLFFYVRISNTEVFTIHNFNTVWNYFREKVFGDFDIDNNAKGVVRNQVIPFDSDLYVNDIAIITIPNSVSLVSEAKCIKGYNKDIKEIRNSTYDTFLDIKECNKHIIWKTPYDIGDADYATGDYQVGSLYIPRLITDGKKHKVYRSMVNVILFNNSSIEYKYIVSFINYVNQNHTDKPMKMSEMIFVVKSEYNRVKETGEYNGIQNKHVIVNEKYKGAVRQKIGAKAYGEYRVSKSKAAIKMVVDEMKAQNIKPTIKKVADILKGRLGEATIKRHWRTVVPKQVKQTGVTELIDLPDDSIQVNMEMTSELPNELITFNQFMQQHPHRPIMSMYELRREYELKYFVA